MSRDITHDSQRGTIPRKPYGIVKQRIQSHISGNRAPVECGNRQGGNVNFDNLTLSIYNALNWENVCMYGYVCEVKELYGTCGEWYNLTGNGEIIP